MSALPENWTNAAFSEAVYFQEGPGLRKFQYRENGVPFLNIRTLVGERVDKSICKFLDEREANEKYSHFFVNAGDILVATSGSIGKIAVARDEDLPLVMNTSIVRFRPNGPEIHHGYLYWYLKSEGFLSQARAAATGSAQLNFGPSHISSFEFPFPPLAEQRRIVARLDALTARTARARADLDHIPALVARYKQAVLQALIPAPDAECRPFSDVVQDGLIGLVRSKLDQDDRNGTPYVRMQHFDLDGVWNSAQLTRVQASASEAVRFGLREGDVLFNTRNSSELVGKVAICSPEHAGFLYNNNLLRLRFKGDVLPRFAFRQMQGPVFRNHLEAQKSATTSVAAIYQGSLFRTPFWVPSADIQEEIVRRIEGAFTEVDRLTTEAASARRLLDRLDQAVLAKAFRGELVPQDPADEPANVLLDRIRAERAAAPKAKRGRRREPA